VARQALQTISVAEAATNRLRDRLFAGAYQSGEEIKDTRIADEYGIARPTARIAVQQLISEGMLVREPGYSARVRTFDPDQVRDIFRVRKLIELDAVRAAKTEGAPLDGVRSALARFAHLTDGVVWSEAAEADAAFHAAVVTAGGSLRLQSYFNGIINEIRLLLALPEQHFGRGSSPHEEHEELVELLAGEASMGELERAWEYHLDESRDFLIAHLSK